MNLADLGLREKQMLKEIIHGLSTTFITNRIFLWSSHLFHISLVSNLSSQIKKKNEQIVSGLASAI